MYKLDHNKKFLPKSILELNKNNNFKIHNINSLTNYFNKLKK